MTTGDAGNFSSVSIEWTSRLADGRLSFVFPWLITFSLSSALPQNADVVLTDLASAIKQIFPTVPLKYIIRKIDVQPVERETILSDELRPSDPRNLGPCGSFSLQYACMCDYHGVPYREEVAWDVDTIYLSHDTRTLNLRDFDHLESK